MHNVSTAVRYPGQLTVTAPPPGLRARMWVAPTLLALAVAVFVPVAPALAWSTSATSRATAWAVESDRSVMLAGGVHVPVPASPNDGTSMVLATVVVMLGVEWLVLAAVAWPFSTLIGVVVSTPEYATIAPFMLCEPLPGLNSQS